MLKTYNDQRDLYSELLESLVREDHLYRKIQKIVNFSITFKVLACNLFSLAKIGIAN